MACMANGPMKWRAIFLDKVLRGMYLEESHTFLANSIDRSRSVISRLPCSPAMTYVLLNGGVSQLTLCDKK